MHPTPTPINPNILTSDLINFGLPQRTANLLIESGYWRLATVLKLVTEWDTRWRRPPVGAEMPLHEYMTVNGFGPRSGKQLTAAWVNYQMGNRSSPWAPNDEIAGLLDEITDRIDSGQIEHGDPLPAASDLVLSKRTTMSTAYTAYRLLVVRGYAARRGTFTVALRPGGEPYSVSFSEHISREARLFAHPAVELASHNPGLTQWTDLRAPLRLAVQAIEDAVWNDARRTFVVTKVRCT